MKKILYTTTIAILATLVFTSCEKFLDVKPAGRMIPAQGDVEAFNRLLNNNQVIDRSFMNNNQGSRLAYLGDNLEISDNQFQFLWHNGLSTATNIESFYAYIFQQPYNAPELADAFWNIGLYLPVSRLNVVIEGVKQVRTPDTERLANEVIAQATVARAWLYFKHALVYGPAYRPGGDNSRRVLPFRTSDNPTAPMEDLSTTQQIFDRVRAEIYEMLPHIPNHVHSNTRFGKVATYALLAEFYLWTREFDKAADYANRSLELAASQEAGMNGLFLDMNLFTWHNAAAVATNPDNRDAGIIELPGGGRVNNSFHPEIALFRPAPTNASNSYPSAELIALFEDTDLRLEYYFFEHNGARGTGYDDGRRIINQQAKLTRTNGYSFPEILLMRAEARARSGNPTGALADLNYLRARRHVTGTPPLTITDPDLLILEVVNERRRELFAFSHKRALELKRLSLDVGKPWSKQTITRTVGGRTFTGEVGGEHFIYSISNQILRHNPQWGIPLYTGPWGSIR